MASKRFIASGFGPAAFLVAALAACPADEGGTRDNPTPAVPSKPSDSGANSEAARALVGHWRTTTIVFESPEDENMVLYSDGTWESWIVTVSGRSPTTTGDWRVEGTSVVMRVTGSDEEVSRPYTMFEGQLVLPNIPNQRLFWERISG